MRRALPHIALLLLLPALALASGGAEGAGGDAAQLRNLLLRIVNFALLVAGLVWVFRKFKVIPMLSGSVEAVRKGLDEAEAAGREARERLAEAEARMARLQAEVGELLATARAEAEREKQAILADAGREVEKIRREAQVALRQELKKVQEELSSEMASSVVRLAEEILRREIRPEDQKAFVRDYLKELEGMPR